MMVGLARLRKAKRQNRLETTLFFVESYEMRVVLVVPSLGVKQRDALIAQQINQRRQVGVPTEIFPEDSHAGTFGERGIISPS